VFIPFISITPSLLSYSCCALRNIYLVLVRTVCAKEIKEISKNVASYNRCSQLLCSSLSPDEDVTRCPLPPPPHLYAGDTDFRDSTLKLTGSRCNKYFFSEPCSELTCVSVRPSGKSVT
jgi:hypothetical protein